ARVLGIWRSHCNAEGGPRDEPTDCRGTPSDPRASPIGGAAQGQASGDRDRGIRWPCARLVAASPIRSPARPSRGGGAPRRADGGGGLAPRARADRVAPAAPLTGGRAAQIASA